MKKGNGRRQDNIHFADNLFSTNNEALDSICDTNINFLKNIVDIQFNYLNLWHDFVNTQLERLSTAKEISDLSAVESGIATEFSNKLSEINNRLYGCVWKAMEKQMEYYNLPYLPENYKPLFEGFENALKNNIKKTPRKNIESGAV